MSTPSPYQAALATGNAIGGAYQNYKDRTAIDEILEKASATGNEGDVDYAMSQILSRVSPEKQQMALAILQKKKAEVQANNQKNKEKSAYEAQGIPKEVADLGDEAKKDYFKRRAEEQKRSSKVKAYEKAGFPGYYAEMDPATQRALIEGKRQEDLFNQVAGFGKNQSSPYGQQTPIVDENINIEELDQVPSVPSAPLNMDTTLNQFSQTQGTPGTPRTQPMQPQGFERYSDQQLVLMSGMKGGVGQSAKAEQQRRIEARKIDQKNKDYSRKEQLEFHKESADYDKDVMKKANIARKQLEAVKDISESIQSGKVKPNTISNIFSGLGPVGDKIANAFKSAEQGKFEAALPLLVEGWKDVFGTRITDADLKLIQTKLPAIGNDPEANKAILKVIEKYAKPHLIREQVSRELKKKYANLRPLGFENMVEEETQRRLEIETPTGEKTAIIIDPTGKRRRIPISQLDQAINAGGKVL